MILGSFLLALNLKKQFMDTGEGNTWQTI